MAILNEHVLCANDGARYLPQAAVGHQGSDTGGPQPSPDFGIAGAATALSAIAKSIFARGSLLLLSQTTAAGR